MKGPHTMNLKDWTKEKEGFRSKPYQCPTGHLTIGWGHNLEARGLPQWMCEALLDTALAEADSAALRIEMEHGLELNPGRHRALAAMCFQIGETGVLKFKNMLDWLARRNWKQAERAALDSLWHKQSKGRAEEVAQGFRTGQFPV